MSFDLSNLVAWSFNIKYAIAVTTRSPSKRKMSQTRKQRLNGIYNITWRMSKFEFNCMTSRNLPAQQKSRKTISASRGRHQGCVCRRVSSALEGTSREFCHDGWGTASASESQQCKVRAGQTDFTKKQTKMNLEWLLVDCNYSLFYQAWVCWEPRTFPPPLNTWAKHQQLTTCLGSNPTHCYSSCTQQGRWKAAAASCCTFLESIHDHESIWTENWSLWRCLNLPCSHRSPVNVIVNLSDVSGVVVG